MQGILGHSKADTTVNVYMQAIESGVKQQYPAIPVVMATAVHDILLLSFVFETELSITSLSLSSASLNSPMDGLTLLLRMKEKHPAIPVVMSTAIRDVSVAEACLENGAREYLLLPFARRQLLDVVHYILRDSLPAQRAPLNSRASPFKSRSRELN